MGGIGKSTLARIVYNHDDVVKRFPLRAWVVVSNEFEPRQVFKDLLLELLVPREDRSKLLGEIQHEKAEELQRRLRKWLKGKRYLIVLDDIWEDDHWACFANTFPEDDKGSRLLITSRSQILVKRTQYTHLMKPLDQDRSWNLFQNKAFITDNTEVKCLKELEELGREIVEKCGGLPLAINVVGGLLLKEGQSKSGWMKVSKQIKSHLGRNGRITFDILELSYRTLPPKLKPCFLCLSSFKEDATIRAVKLKNIWISLGYIQQEGEERVEEVATRYLDELVNRNLIQVKDISTCGQIKNCQVHDLIRDLCIKKAKEQMDFEMLRGEGSSTQPSDKPRHRALYTPLINGESRRNKHLRSLFVFTNDIASPSSYWKDFKLLKILDLEDCVSLTELPEAIGALIGLTYLGLKNTGVMMLPQSFRKLKNLEVIELPYCGELPRFALKFISLRHIDGEKLHLDVQKKIRPLKNISRLKQMVVGEPTFEQDVAQITAMPNLSYLAILINTTRELDVMKLFDSLKTLENLVRLTLTVSLHGFTLEGLSTLHCVTQLKLEGEMIRLPTEFPPNVSHLTLKYTRVREDPVPVLEKLQCLSYLRLGEAFVDPCFVVDMVISNDGFPKLEILSLTHRYFLSESQVGEGAMPELKRVEIWDCTDSDARFLREKLRPSVVFSTYVHKRRTR